MNPIIIVDDESSIRSIISGILTDEGYDVVTCSDSVGLAQALEQREPSLVLLDIWLPGQDGMEILKGLGKSNPSIPVIMMSGHAGIEAAVSSMKLGAYDFMEKPIHLEVLLDKVAGARRDHPQQMDLPSDTRLEMLESVGPCDHSCVSVEEDSEPQRTIGGNVVLNGTGLLSGRNTGIILSPADENAGIVYQTLDGTHIPGHVTALENYGNLGDGFSANSTALVNGKKRVRTIEHLMAVLYMYGITNILIKTDEEIPNVDGSAFDFCKMIMDAGIVEQKAYRKKIVIQKKILIGEESLDQKYLFVEPADSFEVYMRVNYPAPIYEQSFTFNPKKQSFADEIAPARSFNTIENIDAAQKMGKAGSGYINSHIILHNGKVINTELRYEDEFVRHKILDLIGDMYLLGMPVQGRFTANMTSHGFNQALALKIHSALAAD